MFNTISELRPVPPHTPGNHMYTLKVRKVGESADAVQVEFDSRKFWLSRRGVRLINPQADGSITAVVQVWLYQKQFGGLVQRQLV